MKGKLVTIIVVSLLAIIVMFLIWGRILYHRTLKVLTSIAPQQVTVFRIYPRVYRPSGVPVAFSVPDPMIDAFFQSLTDLRSYGPSRDRVASRDYSWFLEVATEDDMIQIGCYIPSEKDDIVVGEVGKFSKGYESYYGSFQSRLLLEWYKKYKHRWLQSAPQQDTGG